MPTHARRVAFLVTGLARGGAETQLTRIACGLVQRGWAVSVVSLMAPSAFREELAAGGVQLVSLDMQRGRLEPRAILRARRALRKFEPSVVVGFLFHGALAAALSRPRGTKVVSSLRNVTLGTGHALRFPLFAAMHRGVIWHTVANSRAAADLLRASPWVTPSQVSVIPNGMNLSAPVRLSSAERRARRQRDGVEDDEFMWLAVGNFRPSKDYPNLLDAFEELRTTHSRAVLRIAGAGTPPPEVARRLASLDPSVRNLGYRDDVPDLLASCDALVMGSSFEGQPNAIMEAFAAGRPVVSTNVGGVAEVVDAGYSGLLVPPHRPVDLAGAMAKLMEMVDSDRDAMGAAGRRRMEMDFSLHKLVDHWESVVIDASNAPVGGLTRILYRIGVGA